MYMEVAYKTEISLKPLLYLLVHVLSPGFICRQDRKSCTCIHICTCILMYTCIHICTCIYMYTCIWICDKLCFSEYECSWKAHNRSASIFAWSESRHKAVSTIVEFHHLARGDPCVPINNTNTVLPTCTCTFWHRRGSTGQSKSRDLECFN